MQPRHGMTLVEMLFVTLFTSLMILSMILLSSKVMKLLSRNQTRDRADTEARICMETIEREMSNGKANTLTISTLATTPIMPNSRVHFFSVSGSSTTIYLSTSPANTVKFQRTFNNGTLRNERILASNVNMLVFSSDYRDPAIVKVTMRMTVALDRAKTTNSYYTIFIPNRTIRMIASQ